MKKVIFTAVLLLIFSLTYSQFHFGVMAGYNSSLTTGNIGSVNTGTYNLTNVQNEIWNDFHAGLFARIPFGKMIYVQPELLYSMQNKKFQLTLQDVNNVVGGVAPSVPLTRIATISTVDVPILVGAKLLDLEVVNIRAFAGPMFRFNAGSTLDYQNVAGGNFDTSKLTKEVKSITPGLEAGVGIDVLMFALDLRYNMIADMYETKFSSNTLTNIPASTIVISLGWKLF